MKILIATDNYYPNVNGASYSAQRLAYQLHLRHHDVLVIAPSRKIHDETFVHWDIKTFGIRSMPLERIRIAWPFISSNIIEQTIKIFRPDIIHIQSHFYISRKSALIAKKLGIPVVGTNHFMPENIVHYLHAPALAKNRLTKLGWTHFCRTFNLLDAVTTPTQTAANHLKGIGLNKPVKVISNGIDLKRFNPSNDGQKLKIRCQLPDRPILLFVGRLDKDKNLESVIRAFKNVVNKVPIQLVLAGIGAEESRLKELTCELHLKSNITFTGFVSNEELSSLYALAHVFIMAGHVELQSISTMEAMATGLPVIAANAMALPELVHNKQNGFLFNHGDVDAIATAIYKLFTNPVLHQSMSQESLAIVAHHDINKVTEDFINLYNSAISKRQS